MSGQPRLAWLLAFALTVAGWISAHEVAYRLALPHPHASGSDIAHTRHAYLAYASLLVVLCLLPSFARPAWSLARTACGLPRVASCSSSCSSRRLALRFRR